MWETVKNNKDNIMVEKPKILCYNIVKWITSSEVPNRNVLNDYISLKNKASDIARIEIVHHNA